MEWIPNWVAIIGSGYIGLEFSDVYTALGSEVTFIEAMPNIMPGFDKEIAKLAQRLVIQGRPVQPAIGQGSNHGDWWTYLGPRIINKCLYFSLYTTSPDSISLAICVFIHVKQYTIEKYAIAVSTPTQEGYTK